MPEFKPTEESEKFNGAELARSIGKTPGGFGGTILRNTRHLVEGLSEDDFVEIFAEENVSLEGETETVQNHRICQDCLRMVRKEDLDDEGICSWCRERKEEGS